MDEDDFSLVSSPSQLSSISLHISRIVSSLLPFADLSFSKIVLYCSLGCSGSHDFLCILLFVCCVLLCFARKKMELYEFFWFSLYFLHIFLVLSAICVCLARKNMELDDLFGFSLCFSCILFVLFAICLFFCEKKYGIKRFVWVFPVIFAYFNGFGYDLCVFCG